MKTSGVVRAGLLVVLAAAPAKAQNLSIGVEIGMSVSSFDPGGNVATSTREHRTGLMAGATAAYRLGPRVDLESGLLWVQMGGRSFLQGFEETIRADVRTSYVQVPMLLRVTPFPDLSARISLAAGPAISFETRCSVDRDVSTVAQAVDCNHARTTTDIGLVLGTGLTWRAGPAEVMVEARYGFGLRDIDSTGSLDTRNRGFVVAPRLSLPLAR